jgi:predicted GNAT family acetyltransferase
MTVQFRDNAAGSRFELAENGHLAFADYRRQENLLVIDYVEAAPALRGTGAAGRLMEEVVKVARAEDRRIVPRCGYAAGWLRRHGQHSGVVE